jgi:hypothetical protein
MGKIPPAPLYEGGVRGNTLIPPLLKGGKGGIYNVGGT